MTGGPVSFDAPGFDPSLGTLRSATFRLKSSLSASLSYDALNMPIDAYFYGNGSLDNFSADNFSGFTDPLTGVTDNYLNIALPFSSQLGYSVTILPHTSGTIQFSKSSDEAFTTTQRYDLIGLSSLPSVSFRGMFYRSDILELNELPFSGLPIYKQSALLTVTYNYGVPEPSTWILMLIGVGAVGATMRRRTAVRVRRAHEHAGY